MHITVPKSNIYRAGILFNLLSIVFFCLPFFVKVKGEPDFSLLVLNYSFTFLYFFMLVFSRNKVPKEDKIHNIFLFLILALTSAWSLNRSVPLFEQSVPWLVIAQVALCFNYAAFAYSEQFPRWANHLLSFNSGIGFCLFSYLAIYLLPTYAMGMIGFFLLGISLHVFVPVLFCIYSLIMMTRMGQRNRRYWWSFAAGVAIVTLFVGSYVVIWNNTKNKISDAFKHSSAATGLPQWIKVAEEVPAGFFTKRVLTSDLIYTTPDTGGEFSFFNLPSSRLNETRKHDPLVMISAALSGNLEMDETTRIKLIGAMHDAKHETQERFWSGEHLATTTVGTDVKIWPACNLAYTEKTLTVSFEGDTSKTRFWRPRQEAIYTFYLPEGGVVTSLSLWINGVEEKAIMTTRQKADSAYRTIVGVESRDPSIVHWQEGNTVSVRVFPIFFGESRKFKIGITTPLERIQGQLRYENIYFDGPPSGDAEEDVHFYFEQPVSGSQLPGSFVSMSDQSYQRHGKYESRWNMIIKDPGLSNCSFSFDNNTYSLAPYHRKLSAARLDAVYLDINKEWTRTEYDRVIELAKDKTLYVFDTTMIRLSPANQEQYWSILHKKQFSLFPFYLVNEPEHAVVVSKSGDISPGLDDLSGSEFLDNTRQFFAKGQRVRFFNLGDHLCTYLKSLKEYRAFQYDKGRLPELSHLLTHQLFPDDVEDDTRVIIHKSDMIIQRSAGGTHQTGPDHLLRLFTYNHIMQQLGAGAFTNKIASDSLVEQARTAYVVTPLSSLVVLETKEDYDRFDINEKSGSLKNASISSKGAAPEPHEWALIILAFIIVAYTLKNKRSKTQLT